MFATATMIAGLAVSCAAQDKVKVQMKDAQGKSVGTLTVMAHGDGAHITGQVRNLPQGGHAIHIHEAGTCTAPDFKSAGAHFNPAAKKHGDLNPEGKHAGDLPNITVGSNGRAKIDVMVHGVTMAAGANSLLKPGGTAVVIHAKEDDRKTDPAGNAGDRIACGVIARAGS